MITKTVTGSAGRIAAAFGGGLVGREIANYMGTDGFVVTALRSDKDHPSVAFHVGFTGTKSQREIWVSRDELVSVVVGGEA